MAIYSVKRFSKLSDVGSIDISYKSNKIKLVRYKNSFINLMDKIGPIRRYLENNPVYGIYLNNIEIGDLTLSQKSEDELNIVWIGIYDEFSGNGYAQLVMNAIINYARSHGFKYITLEVPGKSPNARHIYEKLGFKVVRTPRSTNDSWGGLTDMRLDL